MFSNKTDSLEPNVLPIHENKIALLKIYGDPAWISFIAIRFNGTQQNNEFLEANYSRGKPWGYFAGFILN